MDKHVYLIVEGTKMMYKCVWDLPLCLRRSNAWLSVWGGFTIAKWQFIIIFWTTILTLSWFLIFTFIRITNFVIFESTLLYHLFILFQTFSSKNTVYRHVCCFKEIEGIEKVPFFWLVGWNWIMNMNNSSLYIASKMWQFYLLILKNNNNDKWSFCLIV